MTIEQTPKIRLTARRTPAKRIVSATPVEDVRPVSNPDLSFAPIEDVRPVSAPAGPKLSSSYLPESVISQADRDAGIAKALIVKVEPEEGAVIRYCVLTLRSGYIVTGNPAITAGGRPDIPKIGEELALQNARYNLAARIERAKTSQNRFYGG